MYAAPLVMLSRIYGAYKVGLTRVGDLFYGQTLANLISLAITYILACVLARKPLNPLAGFGVAAIQALLSAVWTVSANRMYFRLHKPKRTVVIYRNDNDLRKLEEIRFFENRWKVERRVRWACLLYTSLPFSTARSCRSPLCYVRNIYVNSLRFLAIK